MSSGGAENVTGVEEVQSGLAAVAERMQRQKWRLE